MSNNPFGDYIRQRRLDAHLTRTELAKRANISASLIEKVELGTRPTTVNTMQVLLNELDVPSLYRKHILGLSFPGLLDDPRSRAGTPEPTAADLADLQSLPGPASFYILPAFTIVATNASHEQTFPGLRAGASFVEWMLLNPAAHDVMVEWHKEARRVVHNLRMLAPNPGTDRQSANTIRRCQKAAEWDELWNSGPSPAGPENDHILIRNHLDRRVHEMNLRIYSPEYPSRPWWHCRLVQRAPIA
ncbi:helix-turn-helix domain-containing protein [Nocardia sp. NBC_01388]|uniref:helix-turn-helix domain-containing protein n=1 Tax=Nocardia sp. NBC_01388 TaxID=2903596 RepID=UPI00324539C4